MDIFYPVTAINRDGNTRVLDTEDALHDFCRKTKDVGPEWAYYPVFATWAYSKMPVGGYPMAWILRDDRGRPVDPRKDFACGSEVSGAYLYYFGRGGAYISRRDDVRHAMEKGLPIPGTRKRKRRKCHCPTVCGGRIQEARMNGRNGRKRYGAEDNARENDIDLI